MWSLDELEPEIDDIRQRILQQQRNRRGVTQIEDATLSLAN